jgi:hypothetical protein
MLRALRINAPSPQSGFKLAFQKSNRVQKMGNCLTTCASAPPKYEIVVKGDPASGLTKLADCPFSHRALLAIEEKKGAFSPVLFLLLFLLWWVTGVQRFLPSSVIESSVIASLLTLCSLHTWPAPVSAVHPHVRGPGQQAAVAAGHQP